MESEPHGLGPKKPGKKFIGLPFIGWTAFFFILSLALALLGVFYGTHLLRWLKAEGEVDLQTMGELLGGTLGVAVAFAGAWVAFQIANFANQTLQLQERREASRTANETLEQSIGRILSAQLHFEALLRQIKVLADALKPGGQVGQATSNGNSQRRKKAEQKVEKAAENLSQAIQRVLTNPLAISVLFALQEAKDGVTQMAQESTDQTDQASRAGNERLLDDLSQLPRHLDDIKESLDELAEQGSLMFSPYNMLDNMDSMVGRFANKGSDFVYLRLELDYIAGMNRPAVPVLSLIDHSTSGLKAIHLKNDFREPFLLLALRYFVYTPEEAKKALEKLFPVEVYQDKAARASILKSGPADAFCRSGQSNDELMKSFLDFSARTHPKLAALSAEARDKGDRADAIRYIAIHAALDESLRAEPCLVDELFRESSGLTAFQIYKIIVSAVNSSHTVSAKARRARSEIRKARAALDLRNKLVRVSSLYARNDYDVHIRNTAWSAGHSRAFPELDSLSCSEEEWNVRHDQVLEPGEFFEKLQASLKRKIVNEAFPESESEIRAAVAQEVDKVPCFPRAVKLLCLALRTLTSKGYQSSELEQLLVRGWDVENWEPGPDLLCVACELHGLEAHTKGDEVHIFDPSNDVKGVAFLPKQGTLRLRFELPPREQAHATSSTSFTRWDSLQIDFWYCVEPSSDSGPVFTQGRALDGNLLEILPDAWDELVNFRSFVHGALTGGLASLPASEANRLYLAQLLEKSARDSGFQVTREDALVQISPGESADPRTSSVRSVFATLPKHSFAPSSDAALQQPLKARVMASGGEVPHLRMDLEGGPAWQKAQIDDFLRRVGQRCPLLAEAELFRRS